MSNTSESSRRAADESFAAFLAFVGDFFSFSSIRMIHSNLSDLFSNILLDSAGIKCNSQNEEKEALPALKPYNFYK